MDGQGFPKRVRLLKRRDFTRLLQTAHRVHSRHFIIVWKTGVGNDARIGITVSRKVGSAVTRNRYKRLVREYYRRRKNLAPADYNFIVKKGVEVPSYTELCEELDKALSPLVRLKC